MINSIHFEGYTVRDLKMHTEGHKEMLSFHLSNPTSQKDSAGKTIYNTISFVAFKEKAATLDGVKKGTLISIEAHNTSYQKVNTQGKVEYFESKVVDWVHFIDRLNFKQNKVEENQ